MKNKYFILMGKNKMEDVSNVVFLFPLKGLCVGMEKEYSVDEIPNNSYVYVNRMLDSEALNYFKRLISALERKAIGVVFEDLGVYEVLKESSLKKIFMPSHALTSKSGVTAYLQFMDDVVISPDLTIDEIKAIVNEHTGLYLYGRLPLMYSRRFLVSNYEKVNNLDITNTLRIHEPIKDEYFFLVENEYGTVVYDDNIYNGNELLGDAPFYIVNLEWIKIDSLSSFLDSLENDKSLYTGFLHRKTIYKLPPREDV